MYFDPDEDEELKALQQLPPPAPETAPPPAPIEMPPPKQPAPPPSAAEFSVPDPQAGDDAEDAGAYAAKPGPEPRESVSLLDDEGAQWAALLDTLLNGGRGVGKILGAAAVQKSKKESQSLDNEYKRAQIQHLRGGNAEQLELRRRALELQAQGLDLAYGKEGRIGRGQDWRQTQKEREQDPNSEAARTLKQFAYKNFPDEFPRGSLDNISAETWTMARGLIEKKAEVSEAIAPKKARNAGLTTANQTQARIDIEAESADKIAEVEAAKVRARDAAALENAEALAAARRRGSVAGDTRAERQYQQRIKDKFLDDYKSELDVVGLLEEIDRGGGVTSKDGVQTLEQLALKSPLVAGGLVDSKRLDPIAAKRLILELWGRALTGKAGTSAEDQRFALQAGAAATQGPKEVEAAYSALGGVVQRRIRAATLGNPGAVDVVGLYREDPFGYLGVTPEQVDAWRRPAGSSAATPQAGVTNSTQSMANTPTPREQVEQQEATQGQPPAAPPPPSYNANDKTVEELQALEPPLPGTGTPAPAPAIPPTRRNPTIPELEHQLRAVENLLRAQPNQLERLEREGKSPDDIRFLIEELRKRQQPRRQKVQAAPKKKSKEDDEAERLLQGL